MAQPASVDRTSWAGMKTDHHEVGVSSVAVQEPAGGWDKTTTMAWMVLIQRLEAE